MELVKGKVAMITGGAGGIGYCCAETFAKNGAKAIYIVDIKEQLLKEAEEKIGKYCPCYTFAQDITDETGVIGVFDALKKNGHGLDIMVCAAGINALKGILDTTVKSWDLVMNVNLKGAFLFSREAIKIMLEQKSGSIIQFTSIAGQIGGIRTGPEYAASKAGILGLMKSFAKLGAPSRVRTNCVSPGIITTPMTTTEDFHCSVDEVPMGYVGDPQEVADVVLFLASDMSRYVTGECININGGMLMNA